MVASMENTLQGALVAVGTAGALCWERAAARAPGGSFLGPWLPLW